MTVRRDTRRAERRWGITRRLAKLRLRTLIQRLWLEVCGSRTRRERGVTVRRIPAELVNLEGGHCDVV